MPYTIAELLLGVGVPTLVAASVALAFRWMRWPDSVRRSGTSLGFGAAFVVGCKLVDLAEWAPKHDLDWIVYVVSATSICGAIAAANIGWHERFGLFAVAIVVSAWFLIPAFASMEPSRAHWFYVMGFSSVGLALCIEIMARRVAAGVLGLSLFLTSLVSASVVFLSGNAMFAQISLAGAGAAGGLALSSLRLINPAESDATAVRNLNGVPENQFRSDPQWLRGWGLSFSVCVVGLLVGSRVHSYSEIPTGPYLVTALAPVTMLLTLIPPVNRLRGMKAGALQVGLVVVTLVVGVVIALMYDSSAIEAMEYARLSR